MNKINAIIASLSTQIGVAAAWKEFIQEMDVLDRVQLDAATRASLNPNWMEMRIGGFLQTGWEYSN